MTHSRSRSIIIMVALVATLFSSTSHAGWDLSEIQKRLSKNPETTAPSKISFSNDDAVRALKEALKLGADHAVDLASRVDGYYGNTRIRIPFPPDAQKVMAAAEAIGMKQQVDDFVRSLNRAAEEAAKKAAPIFINAITTMTIQDGIAIVSGPKNSATKYLQRKTSAQLARAFRPVVQQAIEQVQVTKYWTPLVTTYNKVPFVQKVNPDLAAYVTDRGLSGLFTLIGDEERKIRENPAARTTDILQRVFGSVAR